MAALSQQYVQSVCVKSKALRQQTTVHSPDVQQSSRDSLTVLIELVLSWNRINQLEKTPVMSRINYQALNPKLSNAQFHIILYENVGLV